MQDKIAEVQEKRNQLLQGGGAKEIYKQHKQGKLTARERLKILFDPDTFQEIDLWIKPIKTGFSIDNKELPADAVITGFGKIKGRSVYAYSHDFTVVGGSMSSGQDHKVTRLIEMAIELGLPYIGIVDSGGVRIHDLFGRPAFRPIQAGRLGLGGTSGIFAAPSLASGKIPQISIMLGPCYAGSAYSPTLADFIIMRKGTCYMSVASPQVLKAVTYRDVTQEEIGGAELHATVTGTADYLAETDEEAIEFCRELFTYLPLNCHQNPPVVEPEDDPARQEERLSQIIPGDPSSSYDMHEIINHIVDNGKFTEMMSLFAKSMIIGFARMNGRTIGIVANNPAEDRGILTIDSCDKEARFIRFCDAFNIPIVFFADTPGFISSLEGETSEDGLIRTAARPVFAIAEATVPMITIYIGKCFGTARMMMGTPRLGVDMVYSWPGAQVARINPKEAVELIYAREISTSSDPEAMKKQKLVELLDNYINYPYHAAEQLLVNDIIDPCITRSVIVKTLTTIENKEPVPRPWKKHTLIPR